MILLNNSVRSTSEQFRLWEKYLKHLLNIGPQANPANIPGDSLHQFGLAIDVLGGDAIQAQALKDAGWTQPYAAGEEWHFEARAAPEWEVLNTKRAQIRTELSVPFRDWYAELLKSKIPEELEMATELIAEIESLRLQIELAEQETELPNYLLHLHGLTLTDLRQGRTSANERAARYRERVSRLSRQIRDLERQITDLEFAIEQAYDDWNGYRYTGSIGCPEGYPYSECTHEERKRRYDREVMRRERDYRSKIERKQSVEQSLHEKKSDRRNARRRRDNARERADDFSRAIEEKLREMEPLREQVRDAESRQRRLRSQRADKERELRLLRDNIGRNIELSTAEIRIRDEKLNRISERVRRARRGS